MYGWRGHVHYRYPNPGVRFMFAEFERRPRRVVIYISESKEGHALGGKREESHEDNINLLALAMPLLCSEDDDESTSALHVVKA